MKVSVAILAALGLAWLVADATPALVTVFGWRLDIPCGMKVAFGIPCPGCGMTRSVLMTLHGRFEEAVAMNPVGPVFVAGLLLLAVAFATGKGWRVTAYYGGATAALLVANWIAVLVR